MTAPRVLCVDDEPQVRALLPRLLAARGYEARVADSAAEARELLAQEPFALVLCDVTMPGETGLELLESVASEHPDLAFVMVTAHDDAKLAARALELGAYGYVLKPFQPSQLVIQVEGALRRRELELENRDYRARLERELSDSRAELRENEERLRTLVANIPGALYRRALDEHWSIEFVSARIEEITGYPPSDFVGNAVRSFVSIVHPDDREQVESDKRAALAADKPYSLAYRILHADGSVRWVGEKGQAIRDGSGAVVSLDGTVSDISERKRLEQERDRMEAELRVAQKLEAVGQLAAGIAHEINTPVQFVGDSVRFLRDSFADLRTLAADLRSLALEARTREPAAVLERVEEAEARADLEYLDERVPAAFERTFGGIERVGSIVRAMKSFAHSSQLEKEAADLEEALRTTLVVASSEYRYVADVELDLCGLPPVVCNVSDLNQVFLNLIVNAAHAIEDAGLAADEKGTIRLATARDGDIAVIEIGDSGCGIPAEVAARVFDPFFTTKEVGRGSGQGLAIARSVVDRHGGTLVFASEPGSGTTFTIRLPIGEAA